MFWPSHSPDLNPIEMLGKDLKWTVHAKKPTNIPELRLFCKEDWAKIRLVEVIAAKGGHTSHWKQGYLHTFASHKYVRLDNFPQ